MSKPDLIAWQQAGLAPMWLTEDGLKPLLKRLLPGENPQEHFLRVARGAARHTHSPKQKAEEFYELMWRGILCLATPLASNMGTKRGLTASCFMTEMHDSLLGEAGIKLVDLECSAMAKVAGGVGIAISNIRPKGAKVGSNGVSNGVIPWMRMLDTTFDIISQGNRRGSGSVSLEITHGDWPDFINAGENTGDPRQRVYALHLSTRIRNTFMDALYKESPKEREHWAKLMRTRTETGESYIEFVDAINAALPAWCKDRNWLIKQTNICSEILQPTFPDSSVVCILASENLATYREWESEAERVHRICHEFLDAATSDFIAEAKNYPFMEKAVKGASSSRAIGLGVLGWHDLLMQENLAFDNSWEVMQLNAKIFKSMRDTTNETSKRLAVEYGEPEWLKGYGERNGFKMALAPTKTNSAVSGVTGEGIAPIIGAAWLKEGAEGDIYVKNPHFEKVLDSYDKNNYDTWKTIYQAKGSVQHLNFLTEHEKKVHLNAREIDQHKIVTQAAQRQQFVDQGQSLNLFFPSNASSSYITSVHLLAHKLGLKTLYYMKTGAPVSADIKTRCESCEG